jgi:hypothetical protein
MSRETRSVHGHRLNDGSGRAMAGRDLPLTIDPERARLYGKMFMDSLS